MSYYVNIVFGMPCESKSRNAVCFTMYDLNSDSLIEYPANASICESFMSTANKKLSCCRCTVQDSWLTVGIPGYKSVNGQTVIYT